MNEANTAKASIVINAPASKIWEAITKPELVKQYLFGAQVVSDWKKGSSLIYKGDWNGQPYEDKGTILEIEPNKLLKTTYFSSFSDLEDKPENHNIVTYELSPAGDATELSVTQTNNSTPEAAQQSTQNWETVLAGLKKFVEAEA